MTVAKRLKSLLHRPSRGGGKLGRVPIPLEQGATSGDPGVPPLEPQPEDLTYEPRLAQGPEDDLVVGLVGAVGTDLPWVEDVISEHLRKLGFAVHAISMSSLIDTEFGSALSERGTITYDRYVHERMTAGNVLRGKWQAPDAVALLAVEEIRRKREEHGANPPACAFILRSLKRPEEARLLRDVYRGQFVLLGCHTPRERRIRQLADEIARTRSTGDHRPHRALVGATACSGPSATA